MIKNKGTNTFKIGDKPVYCRTWRGMDTSPMKRVYVSLNCNRNKR